MANLNRPIVSFRLDHQDHKHLQEKAAKLGQTPGELARKLVQTALAGDSPVENLSHTVGELELEVRRLKVALANSVEAILVASTNGQVITPESAKEWVTENVHSV